MRFQTFSLKWVQNVLSIDQKAARVAMSRKLSPNLLFKRRNNIFTLSSQETRVGIIDLIRNFLYGYYHEMMFQQNQFRKLIRKSSYSRYFSPRIDLCPLILCQKNQNINSQSFCTIVLETIKAGAFGWTRKSILKNFHIHMNNCKVHNSKLTKGKLDQIWVIRCDHSLIFTCRCTFELVLFFCSDGAKKRWRKKLLWHIGGQNIFIWNIGKNGFPSTFQYVSWIDQQAWICYRIIMGVLYQLKILWFNRSHTRQNRREINYFLATF
jgi:hypothetical protein